MPHATRRTAHTGVEWWTCIARARLACALAEVVPKLAELKVHQYSYHPTLCSKCFEAELVVLLITLVECCVV